MCLKNVVLIFGFDKKKQRIHLFATHQLVSPLLERTKNDQSMNLYWESTELKFVSILVVCAPETINY